MTPLVTSFRHPLAAIGARRVVSGLGGIFVVVALVRASARLEAGAPLGNVVIVTVLIAGPGLALLNGGSWLGRTDVDPGFYPDVAGWSLGGLAVLGASSNATAARSGSTPPPARGRPSRSPSRRRALAPGAMAGRVAPILMNGWIASVVMGRWNT